MLINKPLDRNTALIDVYWQLGKALSEKTKNAGWGKGTVSEFSQYIAQHAPEIKGFSDKNLWRMKQFYETYHTIQNSHQW